jgi:prolipoprotein diacylglyceryltransferase
MLHAYGIIYASAIVSAYLTVYNEIPTFLVFHIETQLLKAIANAYRMRRRFQLPNT